MGRILATPAVLELRVDLLPLLRRHWCGDWGEVRDEDAKANEIALLDGTRVLSAYTVLSRKAERVKVWVITEADRSATTFLLPQEY